MKNKRLILFVLAALAFISIGIGYAALSDTINGTLTVNTINAKDKDVTDSPLLDVVWSTYQGNKVFTIGTQVYPQGSRDVNAPKLAQSIPSSLVFGDDIVSNWEINNMMVKGDQVVLTLILENKSTSAYSATINTDVSIETEAGSVGASYLDITTKYNYITKTSNDIEQVDYSIPFAQLAPGQKCIVGITVTLTETLFDKGLDAALEVKFTATAVGY